MKYYLRIFLALINTASKRYLEYRWNTFGNLVTSTLSLILVIFFVDIIFSQTNNIAGWTKPEVLFFVGTFRVFSSLLSFLYLRSINFIPKYIQRGDLDMFLVKPVNVQFYVSLCFTRVYEIINLLPGIVLIGYALQSLGGVSWEGWLLLLGGVICGLLIFYGLYFMCATLAFWFVQFNSLTSIYFVANSFLCFPTDVFGKNGSLVFTYLIPLGFIVTVPVRIFLAKDPPLFLILSVFFAALSLWLSVKFWNYALKHYTSASS